MSFARAKCTTNSIDHKLYNPQEHGVTFDSEQSAGEYSEVDMLTLKS